MSLLSGFLNLILTNPQYQKTSSIDLETLSTFTLAKPFPIKLEFYIEHFLYQLSLSQEILVNAYMLIENLLNSGLISHHNIHKLIFTALCLSYKFTNDCWIANSSFEKIGSLKKGELLGLEVSLLKMLAWKLPFNKFAETLKLIQSNAENQVSTESEAENSDWEIPDCNLDNSYNFSELAAFFS
jgi:Cyclin